MLDMRQRVHAKGEPTGKAAVYKELQATSQHGSHQSQLVTIPHQEQAQPCDKHPVVIGLESTFDPYPRPRPGNDEQGSDDNLKPYHAL